MGAEDFAFQGLISGCIVEMRRVGTWMLGISVSCLGLLWCTILRDKWLTAL